MINKRTFKLKKSVSFNLILKAFNLTINFLLVSILLTFLGKENYGVWITIYAFINWLNIFDLGLGQGLKLKLTEAFSLNRFKEIIKLISSAYFFLFLVTTILFLGFFITYFLFDWSAVLNVEKEYSSEINYALVILIAFFLLIFIAKLIGVIYSSLQLPFIDNLIKTSSQFVFLLLLIFLNHLDVESSIILLSFFSTAPLLLIYLLVNGHFFIIKAPSLLPKLKHVSKKVLKQIAKPGIQFFAIQMGYIILYSTDNIIIINLMSAESVTDYNIYYKYYSIPFLFYNLYIATHWESFIDALVKKDFSWIKSKINFFNKLFFILILCYFCMYHLEEKVIELWLGNGKITKDHTLAFYMIIYYLISSLTTNFIYVINSYGKLKIQLISYVIIAVINIPLSVFIVQQYKTGSEGVLLASIVCLLILLILMPIQYSKIINQKAKGIWNK